DDELGWLQRREADQDVDDAIVDVVLRRRFTVALDQVRFAGGLALESALPEQTLHKRADVQTDLRPNRLVVWLKDDPLSPAIQALFQEQGGTAYRYVLPLRG